MWCSRKLRKCLPIPRPGKYERLSDIVNRVIKKVETVGQVYNPPPPFQQLASERGQKATLAVSGSTLYPQSFPSMSCLGDGGIGFLIETR